MPKVILDATHGGSEIGVWDHRKSTYHYRIKLGSYRNYDDAVEKQLILCGLGYMTELKKSSGRFYIYTPSIDNLDIAAATELQLRRYGFNTYIIKE